MWQSICQKPVAEERVKLARIAEVSPDIPDSVIELYKKTFKDSIASKPIIANGLGEIIIYKEDKKPNIKINFSPSHR
jgi:hypothetical protein